MNVVAPFEGIGASVRRKEDFRFLQGRGAYTDDINRQGQVHAWVLRSPHAHARIKARRHRRRGQDARRRRGASPARTWRPTISAACPAAG